MKRILDETADGFTREEFSRGRDALSAQIELSSDWNSANAARYAELALFDQPLVTPAQEMAMLSDVRVGEFNAFVKENIRWDTAAVCAIGGGPALAAVRD